MSQWVSVNEKLPNKNEEVLVYGDMHPCAIGKIREKCIMPARMDCQIYSDWDKEKECLVDVMSDIEFVSTGDVQYGSIMKRVTHWQPLPEPPAK